MKRIIIAVLLIFTAVLSAFSVSAADSADPYAAFDELTVAWSSQGLDMYPDYVGGVYFGDDGKIVVSLSEDTEEHRSEVLALTSLPECIRFESVNYSYDRLNEVLGEINDGADTDAYSFEISYASILEEENIIEVIVDSEFEDAASEYFSNAYGDMVRVSSGEVLVDDSDDSYDIYDDAADYDDYDTDSDSGAADAYNEDAFTAFSALTAAWADAGYFMYPPYVGGVYFADNGNLVVALCDDTEANRNDILSLSGASDAIEFRTVNYSYDELYSIQEEIGENYNNNLYSFLVNFYSVSEEENIVEIRVASSELETASAYFSSLYGDKVVVLGGYDTEEDTGLEESDDTGTSRSEKVKSTSSLRLYISIGIIAALIIAVLVLTLSPAKGKSSAPRRYRK